MTYRTRSIDNSQDIIDSRDVIRRLSELESDRESLTDAITEAQEEYDTAVKDGKDDDTLADLKGTLEGAQEDLRAWDEDDSDSDEYRTLKALSEEGESATSEWSRGETLIRDSYFETYAEELAGDIGAIDKNASWPVNCIDWKEAAEQLRQDYTNVDFDGETYWIRSC